MVDKNEKQLIANEIHDAKAAVINARRSGNINAINRADRKLADLHYQYRECSGGLIPDER